MITYKLKLQDGTTIFTTDQGHEVAFKFYGEFDNYLKVNHITKIILF